MIPTDLRYHKEHEWVRLKGNQATVGISDFAQDALGDIVFIELPKVAPPSRPDSKSVKSNRRRPPPRCTRL